MASINRVASSVETSLVYDSGRELKPVSAVIDNQALGNNTLVAAKTGKIRVLGMVLVANGTTVVQFQSGAAGRPLTGQMPMVANGSIVFPYNPNGWFETSANALLNMNLSAAQRVSGVLVYVEV